MFRVITKKDYWAAMDVCPTLNISMGLKHIQDVVILHRLVKSVGKRVCEAGGGNSRVLDWLCMQNECWNVDAMEGIGNGPTEFTSDERVRQVRSYFGQNDPCVPDDYFDALFSISVIEHIPETQLVPFFEDCLRVLKPGGVMLHAIDVYLPDREDEQGMPNVLKRIGAYQDVITGLQNSLTWLEPPVIETPLYASAKFASNPDLALYAWNKSVPKIVEIRARCQSCSLLLGVQKKGGSVL